MQSSVVVSDSFGSINLPVIVSTQCRRQANNEHLHRHCQMCYVLSGNMTHLIDGRIYTQNPSSCSIIFPYTPHQVDFTKSEDTPVAVFISFHTDFLTEQGHGFFPLNRYMARFNESLLPNFRDFSGEDKDRADGLIREIMAEFSKQHEMSFNKISDLLADFFTIMCVDNVHSVETEFPETHITAINKAIAYIEKNFEKKLTIDKLCSVAAMSRCMFTKYFKAVTGMTFAHFLLALRLQRAAALLTREEISLNEIARLTGLNDKTHLSHMFTKHFGMPPMKYKEHILPDAMLSHSAYKKRWEWLNTDI